MFAASVFDHVLDSEHWHFFENLGIELHLPFGLTRYKVLMVIAALIILAIFLPLARRVRTGEPPRGIFWNFFEFFLTFIRDNIAKPYIGHHDEHGHGAHAEHDKVDPHGATALQAKAPSHPREGQLALAGGPHPSHTGGVAHGTAQKDPTESHAQAAMGTTVGYGRATMSEADRYVPFLWTMFLFILMCNLLGMVPFGGSPTSSISVTGALALITFIVIHSSAIAKLGPLGYVKAHIPNLDLPLPMKIFVLVLLMPIEFAGHVIKAIVLAVRLFANLLAGHMVLAVLMLFIVAVRNAAWPVFWGITGITVVGVVALSLLELFVAFLQAYIFTFLTALFLGAVLNPDH